MGVGDCYMAVYRGVDCGDDSKNYRPCSRICIGEKT